MTISKLRQKLSQQKNKLGFVGGTVKINEYDEQKENISAHINPQGWNIEVNIKKGWNPIQDRRQKAYARKKKIESGLETVVMHLGGIHELAHWELPYGSERGCPFDIYNHDKILEAVKEALPQDKQGLASCVANAFEDTIINPRCREFNRDYSGQVLFWDWEGIKCEQERGQKGFTPFYEAFVKLNMHLWGDNIDRALLKRHYLNDKRVDSAVKKVVDELKLPENIQDTKPLFDKGKWPIMAKLFAKNLAPLLDPAPPTERLSAHSQEGQGKSSEEKQEQQPGNGIEQKMRTREGKEEVAYGRYSHGEKHSPNFKDFEQLDSLYRRLSRAIPVKVEAMTKEQGLRIGSINYRGYDEDRDDVSSIKPTKLLIGDDGLTFGVHREPLSITAKSKIQRRAFPDFKMIILDNSSSMQFDVNGLDNVGNQSFIPWGDKSKYHFALLGFYGIENFLQQQGISQYIDHGVALFSSSTRLKQGDYAQLDEIRKHALKPDWGSTYLDAGAIKKVLQGRESFVLSISDGDIANWESEKDSIKTTLDNNHFAHVQIGGRTNFTEDLESWGKPVFYVRSGEDLTKLMVEATMNTYRKFTQQ